MREWSLVLIVAFSFCMKKQLTCCTCLAYCENADIIKTGKIKREKVVSVLPWPDAQSCRSPAMALQHCVWHEASPAKQPCDSASPPLKKYATFKKTHLKNGMNNFRRYSKAPHWINLSVLKTPKLIVLGMISLQG